MLPKSTKKGRIVSNMEVWDFALSEEDMKAINGLNRGWRMSLVPRKDKKKDADGNWVPRDKDHPYWPFNEEY